MLGVGKPRVALLNVGTEELKGDHVVRGAATMLRDSRLLIDFHGFVEGNDVTEGWSTWSSRTASPATWR